MCPELTPRWFVDAGEAAGGEGLMRGGVQEGVQERRTTAGEHDQPQNG